MKYFVSSDIHGFYDEWIKALSDKGFDIKNPNHKIIVCGDLFDRGRQSKEIINFILSNKNKFILIKGNHEDLMDKMIMRNENISVDIINGTVQTIIDLYPGWLKYEFDLYKIARRTGLQDILDMCIDYFETEHYIFVHGWIPYIENGFRYDKNWRNASKEKWDKSRWTNTVLMYEHRVYEPNKTIVCGHHHCSALWHKFDPNQYEEFGEKENFEPFITKDIIALDASTSLSKKVNVVIIED